MREIAFGINKTIHILYFAAMMIVTPTEQKMTRAFYLMPQITTGNFETFLKNEIKRPQPKNDDVSRHVGAYPKRICITVVRSVRK